MVAMLLSGSLSRMGNGIKLRRGRETAGEEVSRGNAEKKTSPLLRGSNGNYGQAKC
jgi:hypothetical protein